MRSVGKGEAAAKVFCGVMNLPPPPKRFYESLHALNNATEKVSKVSMALAAAETLSFNNGNPNVSVAIDGTWQKRGHTSLNGVVTAVSVDTGKVIDAEILSRKCSCHFNGNLHSDECSANYFGNSGGMEVEGALRIFNRSEDGYATQGIKIKIKRQKLEDKKSLGGRNRLTDAEIDKLQRYYGLAIRNNSGNLSAMKQAIWAIFFHKISTDLNPQHGLCPLGDDSWCGYNRSKLKDLLNIQPGFYTCRALQEADHARIRKAEKAISRRTKEARIKNRQLKCRQEDDLADDPSNPSYGSVDDYLIKAIIDSDRQSTTREIAENLHVSHTYIENHLKQLGYVQKLDTRVPHELKETQHINSCHLLKKSNENSPFLKRLITGDEKWVIYNNIKRKRSWSRPGEPTQTISKADIHQKQVLLSVWWDYKGIVYFELLPSNRTINIDVYFEQLTKLNNVVEEKRPELTNRKGVVS
ncbi:histone-lysine N-methyltransferase SETMAR [Trichonephila clavipes]|nr:histone-lysine N-methyltransferase SETMAR [Trichonephila clavipes]